MLNAEEVKKLFDLLRELHGKDKPRDKRTVAIWAEVLRPWSYAQVRDAAVKRARTSRYYPDPGELAELLPNPQKDAEQLVMAPAEDAELLRWRRALALQHELCRERGILDISEYQANGGSITEWCDMTDKLGIGLSDCYEMLDAGCEGEDDGRICGEAKAATREKETIAERKGNVAAYGAAPQHPATV